MSKQTKTVIPAKAGNQKGDSLTPRLRFPEFRDAGEWTTEKLGAVTSLSTEKVGDKLCIPMSITSGVGLVSQEEKFGRVIAGDSYKNYLLLKPNDFAYNKSATKEYPEGFLTLYSGSDLAAVPNSIFTCFRVKGDSPDPRFLNYLFLGNLHGRWLRKLIQVGARAHGSLSINDSDLMALPIPLPTGSSSVAEQQKIADCLSSLDALIAAQAEKIDVLKNHKKGLMQQLFPRKDEITPRLRFSEFRDAGEWEERKLGGLIEEYREKSIKQDEFEVFTSARDGLVLQRDYYDNSRITDRENIGFNIIPPGYMTYRSRSDDRQFFFNENNFCIAGIISTYYPVFRMIDGSNKFFVELLSHYSRKVGMHSVGTSQTVLSMNELRKIELPIPKKEEQQIIADCLSSLDSLIAAHKEKFDALSSLKKGLMQQLFPSMGTKDA